VNEPLTCGLHAGGSSGPPKLILSLSSSLSWVLAGSGPEGLTHPVSGVAAELVDDMLVARECRIRSEAFVDVVRGGRWAPPGQGVMR